MIDLKQVKEQVEGHSLIYGTEALPKGHIRFETRFIYPDGDSIDAYLVDEGSRPPARVSDLGQTMDWLLTMQIKPWLSKKRQALLEDAIRIFQVQLKQGALEFLIKNLDELPVAIIRLGQACLRVADIMFTRRVSAQTVFSEEVEEILLDSELRVESNAEIPGRFGKPVRVDFLVYGPKARSAVMGFSSGNPSSAHTQANEIFRRWYDLENGKHQNGKAPDQRVTIFDDRNNVYKDEDLERLKELSILLSFSDRPAIRDVLAA